MPAASMRSPRSYLNSLDGIRAFAVIAVLGFHAFPELVALGYLGVDVFFVLSGFIMARTYLDSLAFRQTSWRHFWTRRIARLAPAYLVCVLATSLAAMWVLEPHQLVALGKSLWYQPVYLQNVAFWIEGDYFNSAITKPLLHTWSLAVEEQFYLLFFIPVLLVRWFKGHVIVWLLILAGALISWYAHSQLNLISPKTAFYLMPFRIWEFVAGMLVHAVVSRVDMSSRLNTATRGHLVTGLFLLVLVMVFHRSESQDISSIYLAMVVGVTALLILFSSHEDQNSHVLLTSRPIRLIGKASYSLYLWHWPIISLAALYWAGTWSYWHAGVCLMLSVAAGFVSWRFVEKPGRVAISSAESSNRQSSEPGFRRAMTTVSAGGMLMLASGLFYTSTSGAVFRFPEPERTWLRMSQEKSPYRCPLTSRMFDLSQPMCKINEVYGEKEGLLILGDSHADQLDEMIATLGIVHDMPVYLTTQTCDLDEYGLPGSCTRPRLDRLISDIRKNGIRHVIAISDWTERENTDGFEPVITEFLGEGLTLTVVMTTPEDPWFNPRTAAERSLANRSESDDSHALSVAPFTPDDLIAQNQLLEAEMARLLKSRPDAMTILRPGERLCAGGLCERFENEQPLFFDDGHLSALGVARVRPVYERWLNELTGK